MNSTIHHFCLSNFSCSAYASCYNISHWHGNITFRIRKVIYHYFFWKSWFHNITIYSVSKSFFLSFRACLKRARTSDANLVGKIFFNVVQTKCFILKPNKKCVRTSWWGKCEKFKVVKQAILRDNLPYWKVISQHIR